jgi:predicted transcriptional regulator
MHATRVARAEGTQIAGLLLLSTSARSTNALLMAQLEPQLRERMPERAEAELAAIRTALADFMAGKTIDPKQVTSIAPLQMLLGSLTNPATATLARSMLGWDPLPEVAAVGVHILVYNGAKDVQVDPEIDAKQLAKANAQAELFIAPAADHVLKHETRTLAELRADLAMVQANMNSESRVLDGATVDAITSWLIAH